jgi:hypothetical protein
MTTEQFRLPNSLRKHIREEKERIRREFGDNSEQETKLLEWIEGLKDEKRRRVIDSRRQIDKN